MIDFSACDIVFLSYDEPNADSHFDALRAEFPRAKRVHGVKGFDAAHRRAGEIAATTHVVTVDADNVILDAPFLSGRLDLAGRDRGRVLSFSARNRLNGLRYGNGGVKLWPRTTLATLRTHENADRVAAAVDFCWTVPYYQMNRLVSEVQATSTPLQAFRGGFREGVKLNIADGRLAYEARRDLSPAAALRAHLGANNLERLRVWCSVGSDVANGDWAIFGARLGCAMAALDDLDIACIADYGWIDGFWHADVEPTYGSLTERRRALRDLGRRLNAELDLDIADMDARASAFFKSVYRGFRAYGPTQIA
jgi:hypothetical protein